MTIELYRCNPYNLKVLVGKIGYLVGDFHTLIDLQNYIHSGLQYSSAIKINLKGGKAQPFPHP